MKKSQIAEIINRLNDLEVKIARGIHDSSYKNREKSMEWFNELTTITSALDKIWKGK